MDQLVRRVQALESVSGRPSLLVKGSIGQGNWAAIPWLAILDRRITTSTTHGLYVVFLFRSDMRGVYLTLNQGVTRFRERSEDRGRPRVQMAASERD